MTEYTADEVPGGRGDYLVAEVPAALEAVRIGPDRMYRAGDWAPPVADFLADPASGQSPLVVQFSDRSIGDPW